jgi:CheY-like chemotaxis protein
MLYIDDSALDLQFVSMFIRFKGLPVVAHFEHTAETALTYLSDLSPEAFPEIILVDIKMPNLNGFEFVDRYQEAFYEKHPDTLIFITSASIRSEDRERAHSHPIITGFVEKPITMGYFSEEVLRRLRPVDKD